MKAKKIILSLILCFGLMISSQAWAHFLWIEPIGQQNANVNDIVGINIYLHAESDVGLNYFNLTIGFDDTNVGGGELTFDSVEYGETNLGPFFMPLTYNEGGSNKYAGESTIKHISRDGFVYYYDWLTAGTDKLLATVNFKFDGGNWDGEDVWFEWDTDTGFMWMDSEGKLCGADDHLPVYTDNTKTELLGHNGPDFAPVPIPAAVWLLGSGLLGLVGIRRKIR